MTIDYSIIDKNSPEFGTYCDYIQQPYLISRNRKQVIFLLINHNHTIDLNGHISPSRIVELFANIFPNFNLTVITTEVYGMSTTTEYFTHFVEYLIPYNIQYSYKVVYYLNKDDKTIYKYYIELQEVNSLYENAAIFNLTYKEENGTNSNFAYVSYNCFELGFAVAESCVKHIEPICKFCHYRSKHPMLRCSINPTADHNQLMECKDFLSVVD